MKRKTTLALFAALFGGLFAGSAAAQSVPLVEIVNESFEKRRICFYKDGTGVVPYRCFELIHGEKAVWNREQDKAAYFNVKVFKPALIDKRLHYRRLPAFTNKIVMGTGLDLAVTQAARYRLKVCNKRSDQKIFFALNFDIGVRSRTDGWWSVAKGKCAEFGVSDKLHNELGLKWGDMPRIYVYAQTFAKDPIYWTGGPDGLKRCVKNDGEFNFVYPEAVTGTPLGYCTSRGFKLASFRPITSPKKNGVYFYVTF